MLQLPLPVPESFEDFRAPFNQPLDGHAMVLADSKNLRGAAARLATARIELERAVLAAYAQQRSDAALKADLDAAIARRRKQGRRAS